MRLVLVVVFLSGCTSITHYPSLAMTQGEVVETEIADRHICEGIMAVERESRLDRKLVLRCAH